MHAYTQKLKGLLCTEKQGLNKVNNTESQNFQALGLTKP